MKSSRDSLRNALFSRLCLDAGTSVPVFEYKFHAIRKWKFDMAWPAAKVALEVEGAVWVQGRHTRGSGFVKDMEKYNAAASAGWRVFKCVPADLCRPETVEMVAEAVDASAKA